MRPLFSHQQSYTSFFFLIFFSRPSAQRKNNKNKSKTKTKLYTRVQCIFQTNKTSLEAGPHRLSFKSENNKVEGTHPPGSIASGLSLLDLHYCWDSCRGP